jgi:hypothetical protein
MLADIAYVFHFPPSELDRLEWDELLAWHGQALRFNREA